MESQIATSKINGHEAKADVEIINTNNKQIIKLTNFWVAEGAPDVRLVLSKDINGQPTGSEPEITLLPTGKHKMLEFEIPNNLLKPDHKSLIVYCKQYKAYFGHGELMFS